MKPGSRSRRAALRSRRGCSGFTLIDVLVLIVLVGLVAGSLTVLFSRLAAQSAESMRARQALAVGRALLDEVRMMPFSFCDPQDSRARLAQRGIVGGTGCTSTLDAMGPEAGESRYNAGNRFDGITDYQGFAMPGVGCTGLCDIAGNLVNPAGSALAGCSARVQLAPATLPGITSLDADGRAQVLRIDVTVACLGGVPITLQALRVRHAPRAV